MPCVGALHDKKYFVSVCVREMGFGFRWELITIYNRLHYLYGSFSSSEDMNLRAEVG
jgi:hypothetical protein